jgi:hypothetical protein
MLVCSQCGNTEFIITIEDKVFITDLLFTSDKKKEIREVVVVT